MKRLVSILIIVALLLGSLSGLSFAAKQETISGQIPGMVTDCTEREFSERNKGTEKDCELIPAYTMMNRAFLAGSSAKIQFFLYTYGLYQYYFVYIYKGTEPAEDTLIRETYGEVLTSAPASEVSLLWNVPEATGDYLVVSGCYNSNGEVLNAYAAPVTVVDHPVAFEGLEAVAVDSEQAFTSCRLNVGATGAAVLNFLPYNTTVDRTLYVQLLEDGLPLMEGGELVEKNGGFTIEGGNALKVGDFLQIEEDRMGYLIFTGLAEGMCSLRVWAEGQEDKPLEISVIVGDYQPTECDLNGHAMQLIEGKEATCTEAGYTDGLYCTRCEKTLFESSEYGPFGHWDYQLEIIPATCIEKGAIIYGCRNCEHQYSEELDINPYAHQWDEGVIINKDGPCDGEWDEHYTCLLCGETKDEGRTGGSHVWQNTEITQEATFIEDGEMLVTCSQCGLQETRITAAKRNPFKDVALDDYFIDAAYWASNKKITTGVDPGVFAPNDPCTRAQVVAFLWRAFGEPRLEEDITNPFTDVKESDYFYEAVLWAVSKGITMGMTPTEFGSEDTCTRAQIVTFLWRAAGSPAVDAATNPFGDIKEADYFYSPVLWAADNAITKGMTETTFAPEEECIRAQIVTFLHRMFLNVQTFEEHITLIATEYTAGEAIPVTWDIGYNQQCQLQWQRPDTSASGEYYLYDSYWLTEDHKGIGDGNTFQAGETYLLQINFIGKEDWPWDRCTETANVLNLFFDLPQNYEFVSMICFAGQSYALRFCYTVPLA